MTRWVLPAVKVLVPLVLAFFIGQFILNNWQQISQEPWQLDVGWLALSFVLAMAWYLVRPLGWTLLIGGFGHKVPYPEIYRVYRNSELSRYVPGGIWQFASRVYLTRRYNVKTTVCLAATMLDMVLAALAATIPAAWLAGSAIPSLSSWQKSALLALPLLACAVVYPPLLNAWLTPLAKILNLRYQRLEIRFLHMLRIWVMYVLTWILLAFAMSAFAQALLPSFQSSQLGYIAGSYALAWLAALMTMISPAGMGVREGILGLLLSQIVTAGTAMTLAIAMRLWVLVMELLWCTVGYLMPRKMSADTTWEDNS